MKEIELTQGKVALVDDEDYEYLRQWKWYYGCEGGKNKSGYAVRSITNPKRALIFMHRVIMSTPTGMETDHINCNKTDNRKENLRVCTRLQNKKNNPLMKNNKTGYKGVSINNNRYKVKISVNKKQIHLGYFDKVEDAAKTYNLAALKYHGKFARLNEICLK